jgi:hypothetical protein
LIQILFFFFYFQRENELLRERLSKLETPKLSSSNSSTISKTSSNQQQDNTFADLDDLESNISSSSIPHETIINDQPKYFDRKRRLLAAEQTIPSSENDILITKKSSPYKKPCLDEIVDSLNQKAQAEQEENDEDQIKPPTINEREDEDEDIDIENEKLADDEH